MNQINPVEQQKKKSPLETFANITGIGLNIASMADKIGEMKDRKSNLTAIKGTVK